MALGRAAAGKKVVPKKRLPEFAQLKAPEKKKRRQL
jgi:23S rRNA pseudouridine2605 synthase